MPFATTWIDPEDIIFSEIRQRKTSTTCYHLYVAGREWMTEDEMVGQHHLLNGHEFEQVLGVGDGQGNLGCCSPWGHTVRHV